MRGSGGLQTLLPKSFAEELSAKKIELMIAIMSKKTCFVFLGFFFFYKKTWLFGVFFACLFYKLWPLL